MPIVTVYGDTGKKYGINRLLTTLASRGGMVHQCFYLKLSRWPAVIKYKLAIHTAV